MARRSELDVNGGILHFGVNIGLGGDADITVAEVAADEIHILGALIEQGAAGVAQLVGGQLAVVWDFVIVIECFKLTVAEVIGGDVVAVQDGDKARCVVDADGLGRGSIVFGLGGFQAVEQVGRDV